MAGPLKPLDIEAMDKVVLDAEDIAKMDKITAASGKAQASGPLAGLERSGLLAVIKAMTPGFKDTPAMVGSGGDVKTLPSPQLPPVASVLPLLFGNVPGLKGAAARTGAAGLGGMLDEKNIKGGLMPAAKTAAVEAAVPLLTAPLRVLPGVRNLFPQHPSVSYTNKTYSHSPWSGQSMQLPGPTPSPILGPHGQPMGYTPSPFTPPPATGPVTMTEKTVTHPARTYSPNLPPQLRALIEYITNQMGPTTP
jgi:hypothetical protein